MGFPLIRVRRDINNTITATQERFLLTWQLHNDTSDSTQWYVPLSYVTDEQPTQPTYIWMNMTDVIFQVSPTVKWIKFNVNQTGFYRVMYEDGWGQLVDLLLTNHTALSPADRASLLDDAFTLCRAGLISPVIPLRMTFYLRNESEYVPWATALSHLWSWRKWLYEQPSHMLLLRHMCWILDPIYKKMGWHDHGHHLEKLLRSDILSSAVNCENPDAVQQATSKFRTWMVKRQRLPPNLREVVYASGVKYGGMKEWQYCWDQYNKTVVPSEKKILLKAMGVAMDPWILIQYLGASLDRERIRPQDVRTVLSVVASNPYGRLLAWRHLRAHWDFLQNLFGHGSMTMSNLISSVVAHFATDFDYNEVYSFFHQLDVGSASRALQQSLETIQLNAHWLRNNGKEVEKWLKDNVIT